MTPAKKKRPGRDAYRNRRLTKTLLEEIEAFALRVCELDELPGKRTPDRYHRQLADMLMFVRGYVRDWELPTEDRRR